MRDPQEIWQLGQWIGRRENGAVRLGWSDGELILRLHEGRIRFVEGVDTSELADRLSCVATGSIDLLEEARALARSGQISETSAMGGAKELLQDRLRMWMRDPEREIETVDGEPDEVEGATISITHALVELVLSDTTGGAAAAVLPDLDVLLTRSPDFLDLYAPLRLSEEADLIVAKISGERTAREVAERSDHDLNEVARLLAALVITGILEPEPNLAVDGDVDLLPVEGVDDGERRRIPVLWILIAAAALIGVLATIAWFMSRGEPSGSAPAAAAAVSASGDLNWSLVVDMGCDPQDLQRVLNKAQQNSENVRPVATESGEEEPCWRLVWGRFSSSEAAMAAAADVPSAIRQEGFEPHAIELSAEDWDSPGAPGG
ncbi:MAG: hypothetical protein PVG92_03260 [Holophagae bacterium]|jgi:hypothetical protein